MAYIGREPTFGAFETQDFVGTGSQQDFVLDFAVSTASSLSVWVNNVSQVPNTQFNTLGTILRFVGAPGLSATIKVVYLGRQNIVPTVADGSVSENQLTNGSVTAIKIANNAVNSTKIDIFKNTPDASAIYEINDSTTQGVLSVPKMTESQRDAISSPATSLVIYNTTTNKLNIYNGTIWEGLGSTLLSESNAADIFTNFVKDMEDHGRTSLHTEKGFVDEFEASNDMIDEANSSGFSYDATDDFYTNDAGATNLNDDKTYTTESNYIQQSWDEVIVGANVVFTNGSTTVTTTGVFPINCANGRISQDGTNWYDISSRDSANQLTLSVVFAQSTVTGTFDIRMTEFDSGVVKLNSFTSGSSGSDVTSGETFTTDNPIQSGVIGNVFDDNSNTNVNFLSSNTALLPRHIAVEYGSARTVTKVTINCNGSEGRGQGVTFKVQGSNDGSTWITIHTETGYNFATGNSSTDDFTFSNTTAYVHWRIRWENSFHTSQAPSQNGGFPTMYEIEMMESSHNNAITEYVSVSDSFSQSTDVSTWSDINLANVTEDLNSQNAYYWLSFDPASNYGPGTEIVVPKPASVDDINSNTVIYLPSDTNFTDTSTATNKGAGTAVGSNPPTVSTTQKQFGVGSVNWSTGNDGNYVTYAANDYRLMPSATTDLWTIDWFVYFSSSVASNTAIAGVGTTSSSYWMIQHTNSTTFDLECYDNSGGGNSNEQWTITAPSTGQWYHYALIKGWGGDSTKVALCIDGVANGTVNDWTTDFHTPQQPAGTFYLGRGAFPTNRNMRNGYIDNFRIQREAVWTANFTPPASAYTSTNTFPAYIRPIAKNDAGTWKHNINASANNTFTPATSTVNDMMHSVSQAVSSEGQNRLTGAELSTLIDADFNLTNGFSTSDIKVTRGLTLVSSSVNQNPEVSLFRLNYDAEPLAIDLRTKQWAGTGGTPSAPSASPETIYLFVVDEQTSGTPVYAISRDGGVTYTTITFDASWVFNGLKSARRATVDVSSQPVGTDPRLKVTNSSGDNYKLHAVGLQTK